MVGRHVISYFFFIRKLKSEIAQNITITITFEPLTNNVFLVFPQIVTYNHKKTLQLEFRAMMLRICGAV
jgi:hypothetical protein